MIFFPRSAPGVSEPELDWIPGKIPEKSGDKQAAVAPQVDAPVKDLAAIGEANAARQFPNAAKNIESFNSGIAALKKNYPDKTANSKLLRRSTIYALPVEDFCSSVGSVLFFSLGRQQSRIRSERL